LFISPILLIYQLLGCQWCVWFRFSFIWCSCFHRLACSFSLHMSSKMLF